MHPDGVLYSLPDGVSALYTLPGKSIFLSQVLWYSLVPETFSKAVGALLRTAARPGLPDGLLSC